MVTICAERQSRTVRPHWRLLRGERECIAFNEHYSGDGAIIYKHACALGCEGIVSKRLGSPYRAGRAAS
jgi:bifunctional non-homologous end joining protein LigD